MAVIIYPNTQINDIETDVTGIKAVTDVIPDAGVMSSIAQDSTVALDATVAKSATVALDATVAKEATLGVPAVSIAADIATINTSNTHLPLFKGFSTPQAQQAQVLLIGM